VKAEELLWLYQQGERNFRGQKLVGQSFAGHDLSGADFSKADLRGANFSRAQLRGCLFQGVRAGLTRLWTMLIFVTFAGICALLGMGLSVVNQVAADSLAPFATLGFEAAIVRWIVIGVLGVFLFIARYNDVESGFSLFTFAFLATLVAVGLASAAIPVASLLAIGVGVAYCTLLLAGVAGLVVAIAAHTVGEASAVVLITIFAFSALLLEPRMGIDLLMITLAISINVLSAYACWRTLHHGEGSVFIRTLVGSALTFIAVRVGTSFRGADLTQTDFRGAKLNGTDFSRVITENTQESLLLG
jgi:hypothetical protein